MAVILFVGLLGGAMDWIQIDRMEREVAEIVALAEYLAETASPPDPPKKAWSL